MEKTELQKQESSGLVDKGDGVGFKQLPLVWKAVIALLSILCIILLIMVIVAFTRSAKGSSDGKIRAKKNQAEGAGCKSKLNMKIDTENNVDSMFHDLTEKELISIRDYIHKQPSLNTTLFEKAGLKHNFIHTIELFLPDKAKALQYLDGKASKPERNARVILFRGAMKAQSVVELLVGPLPDPNRHEVLNLNKRKTTIPFYARPFTWFETKNLLPLITQTTKEAFPLLKDSFGYWMHNCTDKCLNWFPIAQPSTKEPEKRYSWVQFARKIKGVYLFNVPLQFLVDYTDPENTRLLNVVYNNQKFNAVSELMTSYRAGKLKMMYLKEPSEEIKLRATMKRRGQPVPSMPTRGPTLVEPNGRRFSVRGNRVSYMNWRFDFGIRPTAGLGIFDVRFKGNRIAYEISLQEGIAYYSGFDPETSNTHYIDSVWGLGSSNTHLMRGIDCPETAVYLDSVVFVQTDKPIKNTRSICIFEANSQMPLWRHFDIELNKYTTGVEGMWAQGGLLDSALVIRVVSTPFNYDYMFDYVLHQNGVIEVKTTPSGYINPAVYTPQEADYGLLSMDHMIGTIHDHFILYKVDLDVAGRKNTYQTVDVVAKNISYEWEANSYRIKKQVVKNKKKNEKEALLRYDFDKPKYLVFSNENQKNTYGQPKGYRIDIQSKCKQLYSDDYWMNDVVSWTKYQLAVTKHNDKEPFGSSIHNQYSFLDPAFNFDSMINDNEAIENEDLVAWVSVGGLHIPNTEDIPMTTTAGGNYKFVIRPFGYFDEDPSMASTDSVLLDKEKDGSYKQYTYGTPEDSSCPVPKRKIW